MKENSVEKDSEPAVDWSVFVPALIVVLVASIPLILFPNLAAETIDRLRNAVLTNFLWLYLSVGLAALCFCAWLAFGRYAHVKLGAPDEPPEYSNAHWVAMMFTAAIGGSVIAWGFA